MCFFIVFLDFNLILIFINSTFSYISRLSTLFLLPFWFKSSFTILKPSNHSMLFLLDLMIMMMITTFNDENWNFFICCRLNVKWKLIFFSLCFKPYHFTKKFFYHIIFIILLCLLLWYLNQLITVVYFIFYSFLASKIHY